MNMKNPKIYTPTPKTPPKREFSFSQIVLAIFYLSILVGAVYFLFFSQVFEINQIKTSGLSLIDRDSFEKELYQYKHKNLLLLNTLKIRLQLLKQYSELTTLKVTKSLPTALEVCVEERKPSLVWRKEGIDYLVDEDGYIILEGDKDFFQDYLVLYDQSDTQLKENEPVVSSEFLKFAKTTKRLLDQNKLFQEFEFFLGNSNYELKVVTPGFPIFFNTVREAKEQVLALEEVYPEIHKKVVEYIDLRVPGKVFYK